MGFWSWLFGGKNPDPKGDNDCFSEWESSGLGKVKRFLPENPADFRVYLPGITVAGLRTNRDEMQDFADSESQSLALELEPYNEHDENAIRVIGISKGRGQMIGYVPKDVARRIVKSGMFDVIQPRLDRIFEAGDYDPDKWDGPYLEINFQIIGPKELKDKFLGIKPPKKAPVKVTEDPVVKKRRPRKPKALEQTP